MPSLLAGPMLLYPRQVFARPRYCSGMTVYGTFYLFTGICVVSWVWMWYCVPETRRRSLEEIETMLREKRIR